MNNHFSRKGLVALIFVTVALLAGCQSDPVALPTEVAALPSLTPSPDGLVSPIAQATVPPTWTVEAGGLPPLPTSAGLPTFTPKPSSTPFATFAPAETATPVPSDTPVAPPSLTPSPTAPPVSATNLLPNASFEEGWYHQANIPELQLPNGWDFQWDEGSNWLDSDPWNRFVRPETRVLTSDFLPADERDLFIWDGDQTVKIFKREGSMSFRLTTDVDLEPGSYLFTIQVFPNRISITGDNFSGTSTSSGAQAITPASPSNFFIAVTG